MQTSQNAPHTDQTTLTVLGIETSCDETAAAVVRHSLGQNPEILSNVIRADLAAHAPFGGVVPEIAARAHAQIIEEVTRLALDEAKVDIHDLSAIAATSGPGLIGGVLVGLGFAKGLAAAAQKPLIAVNHLEGHALTARLTGEAAFPYLLLLVSGGHSQIIAVHGLGDYEVLGGTIDDAVGEAFDKTAKLMGLGYPGGPEVDRLAKLGNASRFNLPEPLRLEKSGRLSFSGLKTAVRMEAEALAPLNEQDVADLCASFQLAAVNCLETKLKWAIKTFEAKAGKNRPLVVAGGVAANTQVRAMLEKLGAKHAMPISLPPFLLCTDNGAMIAWAGLERLRAGAISGLDVGAKARWPLASLQKIEAA